ncbi:MAG: hypothetical protein ACLPID_12820 [Beijerinckiaceae bacterium]
MKQNLPAPFEGAQDVAKLTTGIAAALGSMFFPAAALAAPAINFLIDRIMRPAQEILLAELKSGNIGSLSEEQFAQYVPMSYKFFEAAK